MFILDTWGDPRVLGWTALGLLVIFAVIHRRAYRVWPDRDSWIRAGLALLAILSGTLIAAIFLLTKPPAYDRLSHELQALLGVVIVVVFGGFAVKEMKGIFIREQPNVESVKPKESPVLQAKGKGTSR